MKKPRSNRIYLLIIAFLSAVLLTCGFSAAFYAKYLAGFSDNYFSLDVKANYYITFDGKEATISVASASGTWSDITDKSAKKTVEVGQVLGDLPTVVKEGYTLLGWVGKDIPEEYQEVEYLESSGSQYIDTGYIPKSKNLKTRAVFKENATGDMNVIGSYQGHEYIPGAADQRVYPVSVYGGRIFYGLFNENVGLNTSPFNHNTTDYYDVTTVYTDGYQYMTVEGLDGKLTSNKTYNALDNGVTWYIFARHENTAIKTYNRMRLRLIQVYEDGILVHEYKPVYRIEDTKPGLYDTVSHEFLTNSGTSEFTYGKDIHNPAIYGILKPDTQMSVAKDFTASPVWQINKYKLTLHHNMGEGTTVPSGFNDGDILDVTYGDTFEELPKTDRFGYDFEGWFDDPTGGNEYKPEDTVKDIGDIDLYPHWTPKNVVVSFDTNGAESATPSQVTYKFDDYFGSLPVPTKTGYVFKGWDISGVADEYKQVEYIESNGNQYIDLGYIPSSSNLRTRMILAEKIVGDKNVVGSCHDKEPYDRVYPISVINQTFFFGLYEHNYGYDSGTPKSPFKYELNKMYDVDVTYKSGYQIMTVTDMDGVPLADPLIWDKTYDTLNNEVSWYLFARNQKTYTFGYNSMQFKLLQIYEDDALVHEYIPVVRTRDIKPGIYDIRTGAFLTNCGNGADFTYGEYDDHSRIVDEDTRIDFIDNHILYAKWEPVQYTITYHALNIPDEYQEVEYLESPEGGNYIMTDIYPTNDMMVDLEWYTAGLSSNYIIGSRLGSEGTIVLSQSGSNSDQSLRGTFNGASLIASTNGVAWKRTAAGAWYNTTLITANGIGRYKITDITNNREFDETLIYEPIEGKVEPLGIFGYNSYCVIGGDTKIKKVYIYENTPMEMTHCLIPCYRKEDNEPGYYDVLTYQFYINENEKGDFTCGPDIVPQEYVQELTYDVPATLSNPMMPNERCILTGWHTQGQTPEHTYKVGEEVINLSTIDGDNIDLYADTMTEVEAKFVLRDGSTYKKAFIIPGTVPHIEGLAITDPDGEFTGWEDSDGKYYFDNNGEFMGTWPAKDIILYAHVKQEYQEVKYIETGGNAYIMTDIVPTDDMTVDFEWYTNQTGSNYILGARKEKTSAIRIAQSGSEDGSVISGSFNKVALRASTGGVEWKRTTDGAWYHTVLSSDNGTFTYKITDITNDRYYEASADYPLLGIVTETIGIFGFNKDNIVKATSRVGRIYIYKTSTSKLIHCLVPCYLRDGTIGLMDTVADRFYKNIGTKALSKGPDVAGTLLLNLNDGSGIKQEVTPDITNKSAKKQLLLRRSKTDTF